MRKVCITCSDVVCLFQLSAVGAMVVEPHGKHGVGIDRAVPVIVFPVEALESKSILDGPVAILGRFAFMAVLQRKPSVFRIVPRHCELDCGLEWQHAGPNQRPGHQLDLYHDHKGYKVADKGAAKPVAQQVLG